MPVATKTYQQGLLLLLSLKRLCIIFNVECMENTETRTRTTYKAAVYEQAVILPPDPLTPVSRTTALNNMMKNLNIYQKQAEIAAKEVRCYMYSGPVGSTLYLSRDTVKDIRWHVRTSNAQIRLRIRAV